ncbi:hypothetical protein DERP_002362 [Dermatophagoides pteronyssinus]|uniref:Uncharacterized protein n=1 Tax=Dermatophagoides pteronyssinus TaxID=6956 RepID=A0ABQ8JI31_DERPT|nr:hypothetical protein DERP_002362 [Dermatophagoides pteronyssinus]
MNNIDDSYDFLLDYHPNSSHVQTFITKQQLASSQSNVIDHQQQQQPNYSIVHMDFPKFDCK